MEIRGEGDGEGRGYTTKIKLKCALVCCHGDSRQEEKRQMLPILLALIPY